jgi:hypothetical protein
MGCAYAQATGDAQGSLTFHETADGQATTTIAACQFFVRGHGVAGASGAVVFLYAPDGTYQPGQRPLNFTGTANATGGFDFVAGPFEIPADDGAGDADLIMVNVTVGQSYQELSGQPDLSCSGMPETDMPFLTAPLTLAAVGLVGAFATIPRRRR